MTEGTTAGASEPARANGAVTSGTGEAGGAAGGGRWVEVAPDRLAPGGASVARGPRALAPRPRRRRAGCGAAAGRGRGGPGPPPPRPPPMPAPAGGTWPADPADLAGLIAGHAAEDRTVGVFLVRLGGFAAGVFTGSPPRLISSKVGTRLVHGRSAAGGQSQQRFARRRENQAASAI